MIQLHPLRAPSNDIPDDVLGNLFTPRRAVAVDGPENPARCDHGGRHPAIDSSPDPKRHRHSPNVSGLHTAGMRRRYIRAIPAVRVQ
jgi:hypothetical protein